LARHESATGPERNSSNSNFEIWSKKYNTLKGRSKHRAFVDHNLSSYGELPIWVAIEVFDFGSLSHLFKMTGRIQRDKIAARYGLSGGDVLEQWLKSLNYVRNVSAHHERLWNNNIKDHSHVPPQFSDFAMTGQYRPFRYLCMMQFFLHQICPKSTWKNRMREHLLSFPTPANEGVSIKDLGIMEGWENLALWRA
jgi:abortive infection bacteriophage resistance protein